MADLLKTPLLDSLRCMAIGTLALARRAPAFAKTETPVKFNRFPIVSNGAEHLVMGYLMRRNILTFKAPPNHEGYDLICIHPHANRNGKHLRIQVKSRMATDSNLAFPVRKESLNSFDYLVLVFMNLGNFYSRAKKNPAPGGACTPTFYTFPQSFVKRHHDDSGSWKKVRLNQLRLERYHDGNRAHRQTPGRRLPGPRRKQGQSSVSRFTQQRRHREQRTIATSATLKRLLTRLRDRPLDGRAHVGGALGDFDAGVFQGGYLFGGRSFAA